MSESAHIRVNLRLAPVFFVHLQMASELSSTQFDVIVIGAGINGAGIARDAAMRGLKVLLLDKGDIGGGTSSWSTRLIHGGLRYLEHGEFGLVRESLRERECLLQIASHLVRPIPLLVPIYRNSRRGVWTIRAGMIAYDALSWDKTLPRHRILSAAETLQRAPGLRSDDLLGAAIYFDAQVEYAERLVLENVLSAIEHGATVMTYARVDKLVAYLGAQASCLQPRAKLANVRVEFTRGRESERNSAEAPVVINAAGPWVDQLLRESDSDSPRLIGGTKGSHLIVAPFPGAPDSAIYVEAETDHRPFFIIPWNNKYLIGTTDSRYEGDLDHVRIDNEEIDYLLRETNRVVPTAGLTRRQILYTYSGVRPLPFTGDKDEQSITRKHFIRADLQIENLFSIVGGKLTTYRSLAEQTVDLVLKKLRRKSLGPTTDRKPLPGVVGLDLDKFLEVTERCGLPEITSQRLLRIYGTRTSLIMNLLDEDASLVEVFDPETGAIAAEVVMAFKHELAQTLADCLLRRTMVGLNSSCGLDAVEAAAQIAQKFLGWPDGRTAEEIEAYRTEVSRRFRA